MVATPRNNVSKPSVSLSNAFRTDMFGRTKVSSGTTVFDSSHRYSSTNSIPKYSDLLAGNATVTYSPTQSSDFLNVTTAAGDSASRESKRVMPYQPGKSLQVLHSFVFGPAKTNLRQRIGYFSRTNGFFLEQDSFNVSFVLRSSASGSIVENRVPQSQWNLDPLDGNGPSDVVLDLSKTQLLWSEYEWMGGGSVRVGFIIDGYFIACHQFNHANNTTGVYMQTASLPVRCEIENTGPTASASSLEEICATVTLNGEYQRQAEPYTELFTDDTSIALNTDWKVIGSLRLHPNRMDSVIIPGSLEIVPMAAGFFAYEFVDTAVVTGGTWVDHASGTVQINRTATSLTGGRTIAKGVINASNQAPQKAEVTGLDEFTFQLGRTNSTTPVSDTYTLRMRTLQGNSSVNGSFVWYDLT
jgi:hypothetical protein